jgi:cell division protein ZapA
MGQIVVTVNNRDFSLGCEDGQEARTRRLAGYVDAKIGEFSRSGGQAGEPRLLLLAALLIADELSDVNDGRQHERNLARASDSGAADGIRRLAHRIETIAARLESS